MVVWTLSRKEWCSAQRTLVNRHCFFKDRDSYSLLLDPSGGAAMLFRLVGLTDFGMVVFTRRAESRCSDRLGS